MKRSRPKPPDTSEYSLSVDEDTKTVMVFMQRTIPAHKLIGTARAVHDLAKIVGGRFGEVEITPITFVTPSISQFTE